MSAQNPHQTPPQMPQIQHQQQHIQQPQMQSWNANQHYNPAFQQQQQNVTGRPVSAGIMQQPSMQNQLQQNFPQQQQQQPQSLPPQYQQQQMPQASQNQIQQPPQQVQTPQRLPNQPYPLTHAQLSPAVGAPVDSYVGSTVGGAQADTTAKVVTKKLTAKLQHFFQRGHGSDPKVNLGFTPSQKMVSQHEKDRQERVTQAKARPLYRFQVTKLRSWRTGYTRLLVLNAQDFVTYDPTSDNMQETNRWPYSALTEWQAKEGDNILLQVGKDVLKFSCHDVHRAHVLTALLECQDSAGQMPPSVVGVWTQVERYTRHGTTRPVHLHAKPYGLVEVHPRTNKVLQTYRYTDIRELVPVVDDERGVIVHFHQPFKSRLYLVHPVGRNNRNELIRFTGDQFATLGLTSWTSNVTTSMTIAQWISSRRQIDVGATIISWSVRKTTRRHDTAYVDDGDAWLGGIVTRQLTITSAGYLVERDGGIVSCRRLSSISGLIRLQSDEISIEFRDGSSRTYGCSDRDSMLVSLLDACSTLTNRNARNFSGQSIGTLSVHVSDVSSDGYTLTPFGHSLLTTSITAAGPQISGAASLFQPLSIPVYCLQHVYALATQTYAYASHIFGEKLGEGFNLLGECESLIEACMEFNASVLPDSTGLPSTEKEKMISGTIGALWGLLSGLFHVTPQVLPQKEAGIPENRFISRELAVSTLLQTLYRLSKTTTGYKVSTELTTFHEAIPSLFSTFQQQDIFSQFWAMRVIGVLLSGLEHTRDQESEYVNKNIILKCGGSELVEGIVSSLVETKSSNEERRRRVSELILVSASDILQSILCSFHDTTSPEHFNSFVSALAQRYRGLLSALKSQSPCVIENTALLLHILLTHAPSAAKAIRDEALSLAILLEHFYLAIYSPMEGQRFLSRYLCSLWLSGPVGCPEKRLLRRVVPHGFLTYLNMPLLSKIEEEQLDELERDTIGESSPEGFSIETDNMNFGGASGTNMDRLRSRISLAVATAIDNKKGPLVENFRIFFHVLTKDHNLPDLIWSVQTRRELRIALESEIAFMRREADARGLDGIAWNHQQFKVSYPSLENELVVGNVYMRLWLEAGEGFIKSWEEPVRLFEHLFRRFLCEIDRDEQITNMVIRCLEKLYAIHAPKIGAFTDVMIIVRTMSSTKSIETQHRLLKLLAVILGVQGDENSFSFADIPENAEQLLNSESISQLCQFVAWAHTDSSQISNSLSRALSLGATMSPLLTNDNDASPSIENAIPVSGDLICPPVWFVASTAKIPPPPEKIRGPFRLSDLRQMMDTGLLSPYDLVTTAHVEEYDTEGEANVVNEAQIDTGKWKRLDKVWQLRWTLCTDSGSTVIFAPTDVARLALKALTRLVDLHKSVDSRGVPYLPIPISKRILSNINGGPSNDGNPLATVCQALLCNNAELVDVAADLLYKITRHNDRATQKLYLTGVFFFACCYPGNNFKGIAKLLHATHLDQHFRSGFSAAAGETEIPLRERSILGQLLPEGLLYILVNYGPDKFAEIFVNGADTPEVIWTFEMRKHLIELTRQHLGDFPLRLFQNNGTEYEYCPMPGVAYPRLEKEVFCHNYYLRNLCDEVRFPDWPVAEPVEVFRSCLEHFKKVLVEDGKSNEDAQERARQILELKVGDSSKDLRRAYRRLARIYHPDKNPSGRDMFESIQAAYELLLPLLEGGGKITTFDGPDGSNHSTEEHDGFFFMGSKMKNIQVLIQAQLLICRRYEKKMSKYKYPAYPVLLSCLNLPASYHGMLDNEDFDQILKCSFLNEDISHFIQLSAELVFRTCLVSPLNAEELVLEGGVPRLTSLLSFSILAFRALSSAKRNNTAQDRAILTCLFRIIRFIVQTVSGIAFYENGRDAVKSLDKPEAFFLDLRRCIDGSLALDSQPTDDEEQTKSFASECITNMARDCVLQEKLIICGIVWPLIRAILTFDSTLESDTNRVSEHNAVLPANASAKNAVRALGMLSGALKDAPANKDLLPALRVLLTDPLALMLRNQRCEEILRFLNSNVESATIIWNSAMRKHLEQFVEGVEEKRQYIACASVAEELQVTSDFEYEMIKREVRIGGVYIRVFNKQGKEALGKIPNPVDFCVAICRFLAYSLNKSLLLQDLPSIPVEDEWIEGCLVESDAFLLVTNALVALCRVDGIVPSAIEESPLLVASLLLSLLELPEDLEAFDSASEALSIIGSNQSFANSVAREGVLWRLVHVIERPNTNEIANNSSEAVGEKKDSKRNNLGWSILEALSSSQVIASQIVSSGVWLELLGVVVGYSQFTKTWSARLGAAKTLSKMIWDPSAGSVIGGHLARFLPQTLIVKLKEGPESMLESFDSNADSPELIWDGSMRAELRKVLCELLDNLLATREALGGKMESYVIPPDTFVKYKNLEKELYIGGVYVSRFLKEPTFHLRDPSSFLEHLLQRWRKELEIFTTPSAATASVQNTTVVAEAEQDTLSTTTTAIVYLCKTRDTLCDKLADWGYIPQMLDSLNSLLDQKLTGIPLLAVVRLIHVAASRMVNVEAFAVYGQGNAKAGVVSALKRSIHPEQLHEDSAFIIEALKKIYMVGLGDVDKCKPGISATLQDSQPLRPSASPGDGPVRKRVDIWDDPLSMMGNSQPSAPLNVGSQGLAGNSGPGSNFGYIQSQQSMQENRASLSLNQDPRLGSYPTRPITGHSQVQHHTSFSPSQPNQMSFQQRSSVSNAATFQYQETSGYQYQHGQSSFPQHAQQISSQQQVHPSQQYISVQQPQSSQYGSQQWHGGSNLQDQTPSQQQAQQYTSHQPNSGPIVQQQMHQLGSHQQYGGFPSTPQPGWQSSQQQARIQGSYNARSDGTGYSNVQATNYQRPVSQETSKQPSPHQVLSQTSYMQRTQQQHTMQGQTSHVGIPYGSQFPDQNQLHQQSQRFVGLPQHIQQGNYQQGNNHMVGPSDVVSPSPLVTTDSISTISEPTIPSSYGLVVETVPEQAQAPVQQYRPAIIEGNGIDARTQEDPMIAAEQRAVSTTAASGAAHGRVSLLQQALACELCEFLVDKVLENPGLLKIRDPTGAKVHSIALLKLLTKDPGFGLKFKLILSGIPEWSKYKSQDHSLLITGHEQKADYFLTDGGGAEKKLLTSG